MLFASYPGFFGLVILYEIGYNDVEQTKQACIRKRTGVCFINCIGHQRRRNGTKEVIRDIECSRKVKM